MKHSPIKTPFDRAKELVKNAVINGKIPNSAATVSAWLKIAEADLSSARHALEGTSYPARISNIMAQINEHTKGEL